MENQEGCVASRLSEDERGDFYRSRCFAFLFLLAFFPGGFALGEEVGHS